MTDFERLKIYALVQLDYARKIHERSGNDFALKEIEEIMSKVLAVTSGTANLNKVMKESCSQFDDYGFDVNDSHLVALQTSLYNVYKSYQNNVRRLSDEKKTTSS